jgi:hypothetical protein
MKKRSALILICFVLFWSACSNNKLLKSQTRVEVIDGIEYVHNTETPLYPEKSVTFVEDLSINGEDNEGNIILFDPVHFIVDGNENIYISERQDQVIKVFDSNGEHIKTIGKKGEGPGEFQSIGHLAITNNGELVVIDFRSGRTSFFDSSGQFLRSFQRKSSFHNLILCKNSSYIRGQTVYSDDKEFRELLVKEFDFDGKEIQSYGEFTYPELLIIQTSNSVLTTNPPVQMGSSFVGDQEKELFYHCLRNEYLIEVYDTSRQLFRKIDRPYDPVPFTNKDVEEYHARYDNSPENIRKAIIALEMPKVKSVLTSMFVDDKSYLWIQTNETKVEEDKILTAFDILNSDGYYYAKVWIEQIPRIFKKGSMYRLDPDENTGYQTLKRYKVVWE